MTRRVGRTTPRPAAMTPDQLRALMQAAGIATQRELAKVLGVHEPCVSRWLSGQRTISRAYAALFREILKDRIASPLSIS